jgi:hypothetical protein
LRLPKGSRATPGESTYRDGKFPETFAATNTQPAGPNAAQADVAISGPKFAGLQAATG